MDWDRVWDVLPHYLIVVLLVVSVTTILDFVFDGMTTLTLVGIAIVIAALYPTAVKMLGYAPDSWN